MIVTFGFLAATSFLFGITLDGKEHPAIQCSHAAPRPEIGGPFYGNTVITGERTFMPLGVNCTYDSPNDAIGPQTVVNSNWPATVIWLPSAVLAVCGATLSVNPEAFSRRRLGANA
jgi:hypothetical protein